MREKIHNLMKEKALTSSKLAEQLEIQPSGISHILSGRNKPSFDLLQKLLRQFPDINPDWLLLDSDQMYRKNSDDLPQKDFHNSELFQEIPKSQITQNLKTVDDDNSLISNFTNDESTIERIVIFYSDNTFKTFNPQK